MARDKLGEQDSVGKVRRALSLYRDGDAAGAAALCEAALALDEGQADAWHLLGLTHLDGGRFQQAVAALREAIRLAPEIAAFHVNLAVALHRLGEISAAADSLQGALRLDARLPDAHYNYGNVLLDLGRSDDAEKHFAEAAALNPRHAQALNNLGHLLRRRGDLDEAIGRFRAAVSVAPQYAAAWSNLCGSLSEAGRRADAIEAGRRAVRLDPQSADGFYNLGNAYAALPNPDRAIDCYRRSLQCDPMHLDCLVNLGAALQSAGRCEMAIDVLDRALQVSPSLPAATWNKALALLLSGRFREGWACYEARWDAVPWMRPSVSDKPMWDGSPLEGGTMLVISEQGFGDSIQCVRYVSMAIARGGSVVLEAPQALWALFQRLPGRPPVIATGEARPAFDVWAPVMSLPRLFKTEMETIPNQCPYFDVGGAAPLSSGEERRPRVGLVWRGSLTNDRGAFRSCRLVDLEPLLEIAQATFFSLQTELSDDDRQLLDAREIEDLGSSFGDFLDTAEAVRGLDLVITVDTATAHLAGALARPVWTLLSAMPDWRWLLDRGDSPWYPTMRLFRQPALGDWTNVIAAVVRALKADLEKGRFA